VAEADLILHVRDIAHPDSEAQARDVAAVLSELGIEMNEAGRFIEVWNKIDLIPPDRPPPRQIAQRTNGKNGGPAVVAVSALTGEGLPELLAAIEERVSTGHETFRVKLEGEGLKDLHRLYELGDVLHRQDGEDGTVAEVRVAKEAAGPFRKTFPGAKLVG
jgi:GTP-binding protein HflX